jgi:hypothetical protein
LKLVQISLWLVKTLQDFHRSQQAILPGQTSTPTNSVSKHPSLPCLHDLTVSGFLKYPYFDPAVAMKAEATKWPFGIGELLTIPAIPVAAPSFTGPVLVSAVNHWPSTCFSPAIAIFR